MKKTSSPNQERDSFGSRFGVLVALVGSAVGLGNLWRFPYQLGENGGAAYLLTYLCFSLLLSMPCMVAEFIIGRRSQANCYGSFKKLASNTSIWKYLGLIPILTPLLTLSFYSVIGGYTVDYLVKAISFDFNRLTEGESLKMYETMISSAPEAISYLFFFILSSALVVTIGIEKGIEKYTKALMPALFFIVLALAINSLTLPGAKQGLSFMFSPDFSKLSYENVQDALGQAFLSLSIGCGIVITYGSYVKKEESIVGISLATAISDTFFALIAGIAIMPAVFSFGFSPAQGPGLVFVIFPQIFASMNIGGILAILFFAMLFIAAFTSAIALLEVPVAYLVEEFKVKRPIAVTLCTVIVLLLGLFCVISDEHLFNIKVADRNVFDFFDMLCSNILMPVGGLVAVLFVGWHMKHKTVQEELSSYGKSRHYHLYSAFYYFIRYIAPLVLLYILFSFLL